MNQIYKVIWSRVKYCYVVVSEISGRCGKNGGAASEKKSLPFRAFLCALVLTGCLMPGLVEANTQHGPGAAATGSGSTAVGDNTKAKGNNAVAVGPLTNADGENSLAAGYDAKTGSTATNSVAIGRGARALGQKRAGDRSVYCEHHRHRECGNSSRKRGYRHRPPGEEHGFRVSYSSPRW